MKTAEKRMTPTNAEIIERLARVLPSRSTVKAALPIVKALMLEARLEEHLRNHEHAATPSSRIAGFCRWCSALDRELAALKGDHGAEA